MSHPGVYAQSRPDHTAVIDTLSGERLSYRQLNDRSNQIAQLLAAKGFAVGDHVAIMMENNLRYFEVMWATMRSGLVITPINRYFTADEAAYVINDCGAKAFFVSSYIKTKEEIPRLLDDCPLRLIVDGECQGFLPLEDLVSNMTAESLSVEMRGQYMFYSSGTTGRPKGIFRNSPAVPMSEGLALADRYRSFGMGEETIYLSPAPIYHAAPLAYCMGITGMGGTVAMMPRFDAEEALKAIQDHKVTHSQWVPTMFIRMLKLPDEVRHRYDLSSHQFAVHAAAPCPVEVKRSMIEWWGPIVKEYYAGSEGNGSTWIDSETWLEHPGSVGRASSGTLHICDEEGNELPVGETGTIYFEQPEVLFTYHNDPVKTKESQHPVYQTWTSMGDVGYLDDQGFLYLTDRKSFMIISGGRQHIPPRDRGCARRAS